MSDLQCDLFITYSDYMITTAEADKQIRRNIQDKIDETGVTSTHIIKTIKMSRQTWYRTMNGERSFNIAQLIGVSEALRIKVSELLPTEWVEIPGHNDHSQAA